MSIRIRNLNEIRKIGIESLTRDLGPAGMAYFLRQFDTGEGDYTKERETLFSGIDIKNVVKEIKRNRNTNKKS